MFIFDNANLNHSFFILIQLELVANIRYWVLGLIGLFLPASSEAIGTI